MSTEAEKKFKEENPVAYHAWEMSEVYDRNRNEEGSLTDDGFVHMNHLFGQVPEDLRGDVFVMFLSQLDEKGIFYDISDFVSEGPLN